MTDFQDWQNLRQLTRPQLLGLAAEHQIEVPEDLRKDELITALAQLPQFAGSPRRSSRQLRSQPQMSLNQLESHLWEAANILRGKIDSSDFKNYIFGLLFFKRLCDVWDEEFAERLEHYGDPERAAEPTGHRFHLPAHAAWQAVRQHKQDIGRHLNVAFLAIEESNPRLTGVFQDVNFDNRERFPDATLELLLDHFEKHRLRNADVEPDMLGNAYEYLIAQFADDAGKKGGEFYTPKQVVRLIVECLEPKAGMSIYDPACGSGGMLLEAVRFLDRHGANPDSLELCGQEMNLNTWAICQMNLFLHDIDEAQVARGDTLRHPKHVGRNRQLRVFDRVLANPPFSLKNWGFEEWRAGDPFGRDVYGCPPRTYGDLAFVQHMLASLDETGMLGVVAPHGILFRRGTEETIRKGLIEDDLVEAILGLPPNLFYGTGISACVLIINRNKPRARKERVLFVQGVDERTEGKNQNYLSDENVDRLVNAFKTFGDQKRFARVVGIDEIRDNAYNLNISRYVNTLLEVEPVDMPAELATLRGLRKQRDAAESKMMGLVAELGYDE